MRLHATKYGKVNMHHIYMDEMEIYNFGFDLSRHKL